MEPENIQNSFDLSGKVAVVTGGAGVLCAAMCRALAKAGVKVAVLDLDEEAAASLVSEIRSSGGAAINVTCNVLDKESLESAAQAVLAKFGCVDILVNGAGGNNPEATTNPETIFL